MPSDAEAEQADWEAFRRGTLAPRVRRHATVCSASVALDAYFPVVERWADSAAEAQAARDWERAYVLSVRAAAFVLEQVRVTCYHRFYHRFYHIPSVLPSVLPSVYHQCFGRKKRCGPVTHTHRHTHHVMGCFPRTRPLFPTPLPPQC